MIDAIGRSLRRDWRVTLGALALFVALASIAMLPANWAAIAFAAVATLGLAASPRLGWLGAGLLVLLAIPFGRGADVAPLQLLGVPIRPQDAAIGVALLAALPSVRIRPIRRNLLSVALALWLLSGGIAFAVGLANQNELRDVLRDARWWGLYVAPAFAILGAANRDQILRGFLVGTTVLAALVVIATVLPAWDGGLKDAAMAYDRGTLRMQFGNSALLIVATAYVTWRALRVPSIIALSWLGLLVTGQILSLTRISIITTGVTIALVIVMFVWAEWGERRLVTTFERLAVVAVTVGIAFVAGVAFNAFGVAFATTPVAGAGENPLERITFSDERSDISSIVNSVGSGGRFATYVNAVDVVMTSPVIGRGLGTLVEVPFAYNAERAHTIGMQPGVDNAYLTAGLKAGIVGAALLALLIAAPLVGAWRDHALRPWYVPGWLGLGALTLTQSFAVSGYGPFAVGLAASVPFLGYAASRAVAARFHEKRS